MGVSDGMKGGGIFMPYPQRGSVMGAPPFLWLDADAELSVAAKMDGAHATIGLGKIL